MSVISGVLAAAIVLRFLTIYWLDRRQLAHVRSHQDTVPARFAGHVTLEAHRAAAICTILRVGSWPSNAALRAALLYWLIFQGKFATTEAWITSAVGSGYLGTLSLTGALALLYALIAAEAAYHRAFSVEARTGFNTTTRSLFVMDRLKSWTISAALLAPMVLGIDYAMRTFDGIWWLAAWGLWAIFEVIVNFLRPTLIMPMFHKFEPLPEGPLHTRVEALSARCGVAIKGVFTMDGSRRSNHVNAFVVGFGPSKRIILLDTLQAKLTDAEIEAVLAHEMGHVRLHHVAKRLALHCGSGLLAFALLGYLSTQAWFYQVFRLDPGIVSTLPFVAVLMFLLIQPTFAFWFTFVGKMASRKQEFEADRYAAANASATDFINALVKLYRDNAVTLTPDPLYSWFYDSHPAVVQRIARLELLPPVRGAQTVAE